MNRNDVSIIFANILDKCDVSLYGFLAPLMAPIFFSAQDSVVQLILIYATSFVSLCARPCGAFVFGMLASSFGPLCALSYSLVGVAVTTILIGCVPSFMQIGYYAPISLVIIRFLRSTCAAGESAIAKLYIMEDKSDVCALHASYIYQLSSMIGILLSSWLSYIVVSFYPHMWRYCFVIVGGITAIVSYIRLCTITDNHTISVCNNYTAQGLTLLWKEKINVMRVALATIFSHMTYAVPFVFMNNFIPLITNISLSTMMKYNTKLLIFDMVLIPLIGFNIKYFNAKRIMMYSSFVLSCTIIPLFYFLPHASLWYIISIRVWIVFWGVVFLCPLNFWGKKLFSSSETYFLVGMASALGTAVLGHVTTPICLWLWYITGWACAPALYMTAIMIATTWAVRDSK